MIIPAVGRIVHYHPDATDLDATPSLRASMAPGGVFAATIVNVWSDSCANIVDWDANGVQFTRTSVYLDQSEMPDPAGNLRWCSWPTIKKKGDS